MMTLIPFQTPASWRFAFRLDALAATQVLRELSRSHQGASSSFVSHHGDGDDYQLAKERG